MKKCVALECSNGADINLHNSEVFLLAPMIRFTLRHTNGVLDDKKFFEVHGLFTRSICNK